MYVPYDPISLWYLVPIVLGGLSLYLWLQLHLAKKEVVAVKDRHFVIDDLWNLRIRFLKTDVQRLESRIAELEGGAQTPVYDETGENMPLYEIVGYSYEGSRTELVTHTKGFTEQGFRALCLKHSQKAWEAFVYDDPIGRDALEGFEQYLTEQLVLEEGFRRVSPTRTFGVCDLATPNSPQGLHSKTEQNTLELCSTLQDTVTPEMESLLAYSEHHPLDIFEYNDDDEWDAYRIGYAAGLRFRISELLGYKLCSTTRTEDPDRTLFDMLKEKQDA